MGSFVDDVAAACGPEWIIEATEPWIGVRRADREVPAGGWKLHVSATPQSAAEVLRRALGVLLDEDAAFKTAASHDVVVALNEGEGGLTQVGKFITVYPDGAEQAVRLASALDRATRGLRGPRPPADRSISSDGIVSYRYEGAGAPAEDPFVAAAVATGGERRLLGGRYAIVRTLFRSPAGAVHLAADVEGDRGAVLKQGARDARIAPDGRDARDRIRHESQMLDRLAGDDAVPSVFELFEEEGDMYLAMEFFEGPTLGEAAGSGDAGRAVEWGRELAGTLARVHAAGIVYRDLNPPNVVATRNGLRLIDFELSCEPGGPFEPAGTAGYWSPQQAAGKPASFADDVYALGATLFFLASGEDPPDGGADAIVRTRVWPGMPEPLRKVIARCTAADPAGRYGSAQEAAAALQAIR